MTTARVRDDIDERPGDRRRFLRRLGAVALAAFLLRILFVAWFSGAVGFTGGDQANYLLLARNLARGHGLSDPGATAWRMPLYPLLLAPLVRLEQVLGVASMRSLVGTAQAVIGTGTVLATAMLARTVLPPGVRSRRVALVAATIVAIWPPFILMSAAVLSETLFVFLFTLGTAVTFRGRGRPAWSVTAGVLLGLALMVRPVAVGPIAVLALWMIVTLGPRRRWRGAFCLLAAVGALTGIWTARNLVQGVGFAPLNTSGGYTVCLGSADGAGPSEPDRAGCGRISGLSEAASDRRRMRAAMAWKIEHPTAELRLIAERVAFMSGPDSDAIGELTDPGSTSDRSDQLTTVVRTAFLVVGPLAAAGMLALLAAGGTRRWLVVAGWSTLVLPALGSVVARYQEPLVPTAAISAAVVVSASWSWLVERRRRRPPASHERTAAHLAGAPLWEPLAPAATAAIVSAGLLLYGLWPAGIMAAGIAAIASVAAVVVPRAVEPLGRPIVRAGCLVARAVAHGAATIVIVPARAALAVRERHRQPEPDSSWHRATTGRRSVPRVATPASATGRPPALVVVTGLVVAAVVAALAIRSTADVGTGTTDGTFALNRAQPGDVSQATGPDGRVDLARIPDPPRLTWVGLPVDGYAHEHEPFAKELFSELIKTNHTYDLFLGVRNRSVKGNYVNVVDGVRKSLRPANPRYVIWFFGGSTMFGIGQRDDHTIPSEVVRAAAADGIAVDAVNFGVSGDVRWQEDLRFAEALASDRPRPDLVVFYDGWNDASLGTWRQRIGDDSTDNARLPFSDVERKGQHPSGFPNDDASRGEASRIAAEQYRRTVAISERLADATGIPVVNFWQPVAVTKLPAPSDDRLYTRIGLQKAWLAADAAQYRSILAESGVDAIDLTTVFDDVRVPVYLDQGHTNERGAEIVGSAIYQHLRPRLAADGG